MIRRRLFLDNTGPTGSKPPGLLSRHMEGSCYGKALRTELTKCCGNIFLWNTKMATCWWTFSLFPGLDREGNSTPLQYSCLENPMDGGTWWAAVHGVAKSRTRLSDLTFTFHFHALEEEMATHSRILAWRIPGMGEPGGLPSTGSHRVGHDWSDLAAAAATRYADHLLCIISLTYLN